MKIDMITGMGHPVDFANFDETKIDLEDIRTALENIRRYNGSVDWSLLQHLTLCTLLAKSEFELGLVDELTIAYAGSHDVHEIYVGDMVSGLKKHCPGFIAIEHQAETHVHNQLGLPLAYANLAEVKHIDMRALIVEMEYLQHPGLPVALKQLRQDLSESRERMCIAYVANRKPDQCWTILMDAWKKARVTLTQRSPQPPTPASVYTETYE